MQVDRRGGRERGKEGGKEGGTNREREKRTGRDGGRGGGSLNGKHKRKRHLVILCIVYTPVHPVNILDTRRAHLDVYLHQSPVHPSFTDPPLTQHRSCARVSTTNSKHVVLVWEGGFVGEWVCEPASKHDQRHTCIEVRTSCAILSPNVKS